MKKTVLVIGGGGREHAIVEKLSQSKGVGKIFAIPGNAGINEKAACVFDIKATEIDKIVAWVQKRGDIDLVMVAPDDPLAMGLVDRLEEIGVRVFGPKKAAAQIEASKVFSKGFMKRHSIPTASYETFSNYEQARAYLEKATFPIVIKADGLALGKGVSICNTLTEGLDALKKMMCDKAFGESGSSVVIEEFLQGFEVTVLAFTDGQTVVPMVSSTDHKRAFDNDLGPNTGGMGTIAPSPLYTEEIAKRAMKSIFIPTICGLKEEGREFVGVIYFGLIVDKEGIPRVIEYNARFGDPEAQVVLPLLKTDLFDIFSACIDKKLHEVEVEFSSESAMCVCLASGGYPQEYETGKQIFIGKLDKNITVYHAGTKSENGKLLTSGGRVLGVTAVEGSLKQAFESCYKSIEKIEFEKMHFRKDIGKRFL